MPCISITKIIQPVLFLDITAVSCDSCIEQLNALRRWNVGFLQVVSVETTAEGINLVSPEVYYELWKYLLHQSSTGRNLSDTEHCKSTCM